MPRSSFTECCVGLVLISPEPPDDRHQRQMHVEHVIAPELDPHLADRLEKRQRFDVAHRAADLDHADIGVAGAQRMRHLISSVMCGITCTVAPR